MPEPLPTVQYYTTPFLCTSDASGELVQSSFVILHNPEAGQVTVYRRAVFVKPETEPPPDGVVWDDEELAPDQAVRLDCDSFARIVSNDPSATFASQFGASARVDGFLTIAVEAGSEVPRIDASVQYSQPDGSFAIDPIVPSLVTVDAWPPDVSSGSAPN